MRVKLKFAYVTLVLTTIKDFSKLSYIFLLLYYFYTIEKDICMKSFDTKVTFQSIKNDIKPSDSAIIEAVANAIDAESKNIEDIRILLSQIILTILIFLSLEIM